MFKFGGEFVFATMILHFNTMLFLNKLTIMSNVVLVIVASMGLDVMGHRGSAWVTVGHDGYSGSRWVRMGQNGYIES